MSSKQEQVLVSLGYNDGLPRKGTGQKRGKYYKAPILGVNVFRVYASSAPLVSELDEQLQEFYDPQEQEEFNEALFADL